MDRLLSILLEHPVLGIYEDMNMRTFDFSPLYRSTVGFEHLSSLLNSIHSSEPNATTYPPYNIELLDENQYQITIAISGFQMKDLTINIENQILTVTGQKLDKNEARKFLHQGIAGRDFERRFQLADHVRVKEAAFTDGLLYIDLVREIPDSMKPKTVLIRNGNNVLSDITQRDVA